MTDVSVRSAELADEPLAPLSTAPQPPAPGGSVLRRSWRQLTSMRTALILLFLLAACAVPGSLIPQRGLNAGKVATFFSQHPHLAPLMDRLSLFDVFAAPWFAAVYLLLFVSLIGCLVPRLRLHVRALRAQPPAAPRRLDRLPEHADWVAAEPAEAAVRRYARALRRRGFRVVVRDGEPVSLGAEKGYLRETGNLLFHVALMVLLAGVAVGGMFGYKGDVLVTEHDGFANTRSAYDDFFPSRLFSDSQLAPFSFVLDSFHATYGSSGEPLSFNAWVHYRSSPTAHPHAYDVRVNHPLAVDGAKLYLLGHGYAPHVIVHDRTGAVVFDDAVPFLPQNGEFVSSGAIKVPDARPDQLGFTGMFAPTAEADPVRGVVSVFPAPERPVLVLAAFHGNLGLDTGIPQSVWTLDTTHLTAFTGANHQPDETVLRPGQTWRLPDGSSITFAGVEQFATFQVTHDPGKGVVFLAAVAILVGLTLSLRVRRRRVWVRARDEGGRTVVELGGLARTDAEEFAAEFAELRADLQGAEAEPEE